MRIITLFSCLSFLLLGSGCHKQCIQNQIANLQFSEEDLKINPYTGKEILIFKTSDGNFVNFPAGIRKTEFHTIYEFDTESAYLRHDGCQGDYFQAMSNWMQKSDSFSDSWLSIKLNFRYSLNEPRMDKAFQLYFWILDSQLLCFGGNYSFNAGILLNDSTRSSNPIYRDSIVSYHPMILLGSKEFYNVYELYSSNPDHRDTAWISTAYYNLNYGLVGFKTTYGKAWSLDKIIE